MCASWRKLPGTLPLHLLLARFWGNRSLFLLLLISGLERALVAVGEGHSEAGDLVARERELTVDLLQVLLVEEVGNGQGVGVSCPMKKVSDGLVEEEGGVMEWWKYNCLAQFCHCLRMPTKGFEGEILKLLKRMNERSEHFEKLIGKRWKGQKPSRFDQALKKLDYSVNYCQTGEACGGTNLC